MARERAMCLSDRATRSTRGRANDGAKPETERETTVLCEWQSGRQCMGDRPTAAGVALTAKAIVQFSAQPAKSAGSRFLTKIKIKNNLRFQKTTESLQNKSDISPNTL